MEIPGINAAQRDERPKTLIDNEYEYLTHQFISNEEMGDKRVSLFLTLTTGIGAAAVLAGEKPSGQGVPGFPLVFLAVTAVWFLFGYVTFIRVVRRNLTTDKLKAQMCEIRKWYVDETDTAGLKFLPYNPYAEDIEKENCPHRELRFMCGGYAELVALIDSAVAFAFGWELCVIVLNASCVGLWKQWWSEWCAAGLGIVLAVLAWGNLGRLAKRIYIKTAQE